MKYSNNKNFDIDLQFAEKAEDWVNQLFSGGYKLEIKSDRLAHKTGNVFIEIFSRGKPSGLSTTEADYWVYRIDECDTAIIVKTNTLKEIVKEHFNGTYILGGDDYTSKGVLIPIIKLIKRN
jgi:hypothetical protein